MGTPQRTCDAAEQRHLTKNHASFAGRTPDIGGVAGELIDKNNPVQNTPYDERSSFRTR